ncbi:MAG: 3-hydroxyacyl-CoA dehydrogenase/enoyl-CoA hydratase family protein [Armatimonadota bacterium]|nr:3-hydroxyacyl-CoA dehydrogenase/enoyl-CoA hydratase family protein [Armatimonadota bacterium]MDR7463634.1 3-hydroxyacyl-CoA dehydrogenase/enoyl-CoA hydratase family protein [Armatimonadota bacterium]MDR7469831.1 3-hydroxyacyl-CoA dehydrogenase/enoyl-CoA hydratase family protein [Armatimonadota bacterium]MDR7475208.1 3-hydroxyacyl-CoA dehydrogenase/enoyl-CoA hydratase family protein [Armatimonadota bacterium]MDR7540329.1 3-hydroxyacyl-CoA dehydrogenase/enoyl-CoA hydratase family protein [Arma
METAAQTQFPSAPRRAAVLGAGVMGRAIAAHLANASIPTVMLDLEDLAYKAHQSLRRIEPAPLFLPELDRLIAPGNLQRDLPRAAEADWIIEAIIEDLPAKQALLARLQPLWRPGTVVSTNTSGLPVSRIAEEAPAEFRRFFLGTHFFNPPRYMKLLEVIPTPQTDPAVLATVTGWADRLLGKGVVHCKDTPNFIANRLGTYGFLRTVQLMDEFGLTVEEVDELTGPLLGRPRTATFRLLDLAGLDVALAVAEHAYASLAHDEAREVFRPPVPLQEMVRRGWVGEKSGGGFYRRVNGEIQVLDLATMTYRPRRKASFPWVETAMTLQDPGARLRQATAARDRGGQFLWALVRDLLVYAARRIPEISDDVVNVDRAVRWGFNWEFGPFETWDLLGVPELAKRLEGEGITPPPVVVQVLQQGGGSFYRRDDARLLYFDFATAAHRPVPPRPGVLLLADLKRVGKAVLTTPDATLVDLGDGVACVEFHTKMNIIGEGTLRILQAALERLEQDFEALVIGNQARDFSAGANLMLLLLEAQEGNWEELELAVRQFQQLNQRLRYARRPVVAAPAGRTLAGGAEICLAAPRVQAAAETYMGLVETGMGLIPAGGGSMEMTKRAMERIPAGVTADALPLLRWAFETVAMAKVARSALEAKQLGLLREADGISMNTDRLIQDAKDVALALARSGYRPPLPSRIRVLGERGQAALRALLYNLKTGGHITAYDEVVAGKLAHVMTGGDVPEGTWVSEEFLLDLEREAFLSLLGEARTQERIRHFLQTGKPLRN